MEYYIKNFPPVDHYFWFVILKPNGNLQAECLQSSSYSSWASSFLVTQLNPYPRWDTWDYQGVMGCYGLLVWEPGVAFKFGNVAWEQSSKITCLSTLMSYTTPFKLSRRLLLLTNTMAPNASGSEFSHRVWISYFLLYSLELSHRKFKSSLNSTYASVHICNFTKD